MSQTITTDETITFEYNEDGRVIRQTTNTVVQSEESE